MPRLRNDPNLPQHLASDLKATPHRYLWDSDKFDSDPYVERISEWKKTVPYQPGDVVFFEMWDNAKNDYVARKVLITGIGISYDRYGDRREVYSGRIELANGKISNTIRHIYHPGGVQRGYKRAGLAPEMPN